MVASLLLRLLGLLGLLVLVLLLVLMLLLLLTAGGWAFVLPLNTQSQTWTRSPPLALLRPIRSIRVVKFL